MNKKILITGAVSVLMLAGCQNLTEQLTNKIAEGVINSSTNGEVKVNMSDLEKGKISVTTKEGTINMSGNEQGGSLTMTDKSGKTLMTASGTDKSISVKDEGGQEVMKADENSVVMKDKTGATTFTSESGDTRPASVPADMPTLPLGKDFSFSTSDGLGALSYSVDSKDLKGSCDNQVSMLLGEGWQVSANGFSSESEGTIVKNYSKAGLNMMVTCALNDDMTVNLNMLESKAS